MVQLSTGRRHCPPDRAGYALPFPVTDRASALRLAVEVEERTAAHWRAALPATTGADRDQALAALVECARAGHPLAADRRGDPADRPVSRPPGLSRPAPVAALPVAVRIPGMHTQYAMSIRHGLLALLERGHGTATSCGPRSRSRPAATWPLNIGQVYTTLSRLERDGLVRPLPETDGGQRPYEITDAGRAELALWFATPISRTDRPRDELAIKLALALTTPGVDVRRWCRPSAPRRCGRCRSSPG